MFTVNEMGSQVDCATGNKRKYGFVPEFASLCGNFTLKWPI
jgi:hypothetical protein